MKHGRSILGLPICCWPDATWWLFKGIAWGWAVVHLDRAVRPGTRFLIWRCWYWPGYVHPWRYGMTCKHDRLQRPVRLNPARRGTTKGLAAMASCTCTPSVPQCSSQTQAHADNQS